MKLRARKVEDNYTFQDLSQTFSVTNHTDAAEFERLECGCPWWTCTHCIHGLTKKTCMECEDPFDTIS